MSNQEQELTETKTVSENPEIVTTDDNSRSNTDEKLEQLNENEKNEPETTRRMMIPQDIRYSTEQDDRDKLMEKYVNYQVSDTDACYIRFITDHRQKRNFLGRYEEEENSNLHSISKTFNVNIHAYHTSTKHSFKVVGTEANVRKCLIEIINRMYKQQNRSSNQPDTENNTQQTTTINTEKTSETTEVSIDNEKPEDEILEPTTVFVTTINSDASITEEQKPITPSTPNKTEDKTETKEENTEQELYKYVPLERKPEYTFIILITNQGQEVLKKNWSFFAGLLQQRLNLTVTNPLKLPKFGDKQWQNELSITGESYENIIDAALQINAFINEVLGVDVQPYKGDEEQSNSDYNNYQRTKPANNNNNNDYHQQQRRYDYNNGYRQPTSQHQGQSSPFNNYHERTFFNRGRNNGIYEQIILIRSHCVARIVGTRASNLRRIQSKCHLRDIVVARQPNENGYVECKLSAYQTRQLNFAIDTIRASLRNEDDQAIQVFDAHYIDLPLQSSSFQNDNQNFEQITGPLTSRETGFMTRPLHINNDNQYPHPSYNFQNPPSFDFTHQPTSASRKTDKRPGEINDFNTTNNLQTHTLNDQQYHPNCGSSSSNSSSVSPRHKSKRTCPETKEIDCTTDDGFWIQKQYYYALDDTSKELFDSLMDKLEKIRIAHEENTARKQQRLVGRNRSNKTRVFNSAISSITQTADEKDFKIKFPEEEEGGGGASGEQETKVEESTNNDEQKETKDVTATESNSTTVTVDQN